MIYSDRQYERSKRLIEDLLGAKLLTEKNLEKEEWLRQAELSALDAQIAATQDEVDRYQKLKAGKVTHSKLRSLIDLPQLLIESRIAQGYSQTQLAALMNLKPQQIQRYESTSYMGASLRRLNEIAVVLGVQIDGLFELQNSVENRILSRNRARDIDWSRLPKKEMFKRKWIVPKPGEALNPLAREYIATMTGHSLLQVHHRIKIRSSSKFNEHNIIAWQARIADLANQVDTTTDTTQLEDYHSWISDLKSLSRDSTGPARAKDFLLSKGIILVIESHLPQTHLDGAAMLLKSGTPVIGLTLRLNRLDNFWFTLFHELGHICLHLTKGINLDFFDQEEVGCSDILERQADEFAVENLISKDEWSVCLSQYAASDESVLIDAKRLGVHPAIVAGRIRKERDNYKILTNIICKEQIGSKLEVEVREVD